MMKCLQLLLLLATCITASIVENGKLGDIFDITHEYRPGMPIFCSSEGTGPIVGPYKVINDTENSQLNYSPMQLATNSGTHTKAYITVEKLDLATLNDKDFSCFPYQAAITMLSLGYKMACIRKRSCVGCGGSQGQEPNRHRNFPEVVVLFETSNSNRNLMHKKEFDSSYTGLTTDGAEWLARNTNIKLIGSGYSSVAIMHHREPVYLLLGKDIIPLEGFDIGGIHPGEYTLRCLPLGKSDASEAPTRCILIQ